MQLNRTHTHTRPKKPTFDHHGPVMTEARVSLDQPTDLQIWPLRFWWPFLFQTGIEWMIEQSLTRRSEHLKTWVCLAFFSFCLIVGNVSWNVGNRYCMTLLSTWGTLGQHRTWPFVFFLLGGCSKGLIRSFFSILTGHLHLVGGFNPVEQYYSSQNGNLPQIGMNIKNL